MELAAASESPGHTRYTFASVPRDNTRCAVVIDVTTDIVTADHRQEIYDLCLGYIAAR